MIITLDGPSGTGKSTLAKIVASKLNFKFLNSGMIYRAITYYYLSNGISAEDKTEIERTINTLNIRIEFIDNAQCVFINELDCSPYVSSIDVSQNVSLFSQILAVRHITLHLQRNFASKINIVIEGRDIGSEVFPNADYKFYVTCDTVVRAKRRFADLKKDNPNLTLDEVVKSLENRDYLDTTRQFSPLVRPENAIDIDTSNKTIDECVNFILNIVNQTN